MSASADIEETEAFARPAARANTVPQGAPAVATLIAEVARLRAENALLREAALTFGALAERLAAAMTRPVQLPTDSPPLE
jgi:hypothetical protein